VYDGIPYQVKRGRRSGHHCKKYGKVTAYPISMKIRLMKALVWPVVTYDCENWTLGKDE